MTSALRVMVVDDEPDKANTLAVLLQKLGYDVRAITDAKAVLSVSAEFEPHIMLLDLAMPMMDGYELAKTLRSSCDSRLIAVTGFADRVHRDLALEAGFSAVVVKPYSIDDIKDALSLAQQTAD